MQFIRLGQHVHLRGDASPLIVQKLRVPEARRGGRLHRQPLELVGRVRDASFFGHELD